MKKCSRGGMRRCLKQPPHRWARRPRCSLLMFNKFSERPDRWRRLKLPLERRGMSVTAREGISIEVSIGEFVDRHLINRVRTEKRSFVESHWLVARVEESSRTVEQLNAQP